MTLGTAHSDLASQRLMAGTSQPAGLGELAGISLDGFPVRASEPAGVLEAVQGAHRVWLDQRAPTDRYLLAGQEIIGRQDRGPAGKQELHHTQQLAAVTGDPAQAGQAITISPLSAACSNWNAF